MDIGAKSSVCNFTYGLAPELLCTRGYFQVKERKIGCNLYGLGFRCLFYLDNKKKKPLPAPPFLTSTLNLETQNFN